MPKLNACSMSYIGRPIYTIIRPVTTAAVLDKLRMTQPYSESSSSDGFCQADSTAPWRGGKSQEEMLNQTLPRTIPSAQVKLACVHYLLSLSLSLFLSLPLSFSLSLSVEMIVEMPGRVGGTPDSAGPGPTGAAARQPNMCSRENGIFVRHISTRRGVPIVCHGSAGERGEVGVGH